MSKVILISGGTKGIGRAIGEALLKSGYHVATFSPFPEEVKEFSQAMVGVCDPAQLMVLEANVTDEKSVASVVQKTVECFGRIDVLINNAGIGYFSECDVANMEKVRQMMDVNCIGAAIVTKAVVPLMKKQGSGQIINNVSTASRHANPRSEFYAATKYALAGYSQAIRTELRPHGIKVATIAPGITNTDLIQAEVKNRSASTPEVMLEAAEVARVVSFIIEQPAGSDIRDIVITPTGSSRYHF